MTTVADQRRRQFITALSATGIVLVGCAATITAGCDRNESDEGEVTPGEDLMQEHGVLERVLLIYDEACRRIDNGEKVDPAPVKSAAEIVRRFVEGYHEKLEEEQVFPRLEQAKREVDLVATLRRQHARGRELTAEIARRTEAGASRELSEMLKAFARMYRPHAAREDTVLFPAFRKVVGRHGYRELGEAFEEKEHELLGEHGFEQFVARVAELEGALGIGDLARFTP